MVSDLVVAYYSTWAIVTFLFYHGERKSQIGVWLVAGMLLVAPILGAPFNDTYISTFGVLVALFILYNHYIEGSTRDSDKGEFLKDDLF